MMPNIHTTMVIRSRILDPREDEQAVKMSTHCQILGVGKISEKNPTISFLEPVDATDEPDERLIQIYRAGEQVLPNCNRRYLGATPNSDGLLDYWFEVLE